MTETSVRLTSLAHGGGCGCKLDPSVLNGLLADQPPQGPFSRLVVGNETGDDAAVWALDDGTCVISTTDFFTPIVDDPFDFGRIAATNAISDVYAMGGAPIMAIAILGMPLGKIAPSVVSDILRGGASICAEAGIPVAGGHSIDAPEPIYGLAITGLCRREDVRRNNGTQAGDALILTKPAGVGVYSAAIKRKALPEGGYAQFIATTTRLNKVGTLLARDAYVHAMTDVTGFGLLGHGLEMARGAGLDFTIDSAAVPLLPFAARLAQDGFVTGASHRNWSSYGHDVDLAAGLPDWGRHLLSDPQTSGGLLVAVRADQAHTVLALIHDEGFTEAAIIGQAGGKSAVPRIRVH